MSKKKKVMSAGEKLRRLMSSLRRRGATELNIKRARNYLRPFIYDGMVCEYCLLPIKLVEMGLDHMKPLSKGGTHDPSNLILCHMRCNMAKGDMSLEDYNGLVSYMRDNMEDGGKSVIKRLIASGRMFRR